MVQAAADGAGTDLAVAQLVSNALRNLVCCLVRCDARADLVLLAGWPSGVLDGLSHVMLPALVVPWLV